MHTLILSNTDLRSLVREVGVDQLMDELIAALAEALRTFDESATEIPPRTGFYYDQPGLGLIEWMPLFEKHQRVLMKMVGYHPMSPAAHSLPTILSTLSVYDTATGHLAALVDGTFLTALRTGSASAVASRFLARPQSTTLGLIGCGAQAVTQLHAISRVFKLQRVLIYDIDAAVQLSFSSRSASVVNGSLAIRAAAIDEILAEADIISVSTSVDVGGGPVFQSAETLPWVHINAVGSDLPGKTELPVKLLRESFVCADHPQQALAEGECQQLVREDIAAGLVDVACNPARYEFARDRKSVFDSTGWALEDRVAIDLVLRLARERGIGRRIAVESISRDPRNPYAFLDDGDDPE